MSLLDKLRKNSTLKSTQILAKSDFFSDRQFTSCPVPAINIALSGDIYGGFNPGLIFLAAPSAHFKSMIGLLMVAAYLKKHEDAICLFYDSEFGITPEYLVSMGVDPNRVIHTPIANIEELKFDSVNQLEELERGDHVIIFIDSVGNLASKKELEDAKDQKSVADMSRAKALKGYFRIITPYLTSKRITAIAINHVYEEIGMFPKTIMSGGTGGKYSANQIIFISKSQEKDGKELLGYNFKLIAEKSRYVREKSVIPLQVTFENGIQRWSGMFDLAKELNWITMPKSGWYQVCNPHTGEVIRENCRAKELVNNTEFWEKLISMGFNDDVKKRFQLAGDHVTNMLDADIDHDDEDDDESFDSLLKQ